MNVAIVIVGSPTSPITKCSLLPLNGENLNVSLRWSPSFESQHRVEKYNVTVTPDLSSCSNDQVSPSDDYNCSGLDLQTNYTITVTAINCRNQEGENITFNVQPQFIGNCNNYTH